MKLIFNKKHLSIDQFNEVELPSFAILLGVSGSGKTHLLKAIHQGAVNVDSISNRNISYFDYTTFCVKNQSSVSPRKIEDNKQEAWLLLNTLQHRLKQIDQQIKNMQNQRQDGFPYQCKQIHPVNEKSYQMAIQGLRSFITDANNYQQRFRSHSELPIIVSMLCSVVFNSGQYASEITQTDFIEHANYDPDDYQLLTSLSEIFVNYRKKLIKSKLSKDDGGKGYTPKEMKKLEQQAPWHFLNQMLREFNLSHTITHPEFSAGQLLESQHLPFQATLILDDEVVKFDQLSSGEKILCALAITMYQDHKSHFPELLLLDEIDASLHPSMIKNLLKVINCVFINKGCKVILATHSPTTAALAEEDSLFEAQKGKTTEKIKKITQEDAISILSEGFASLTHGESDLSISYNISNAGKNVLLTEGITDKIIVQAAFKMLYPRKKLNFYIQDCFDALFLANLIKRGNEMPDGIFSQYNDNNFIALFDFDNAGYNQWNGLWKKEDCKSIEKDPRKGLAKKHASKHIVGLLLPVACDQSIESHVIQNGNITYEDQSYLPIEMLFYGINPELNKKYFRMESAPFGGKQIKFINKKKRELAQESKYFPKEYFKNFETLFQSIDRIFTDLANSRKSKP